MTTPYPSVLPPRHPERPTRVASLLLALLLVAPVVSMAQPAFVEVTPPTDPLFVTPPEEDFWVNAVAPADVDGDGDLDLAVLGFYVVYNVSATDMLVVFLNDGPDASGNWTFTTQTVPLGTLFAGSSDLAWGDYDGDGDDDLVVASEGETVLYRNDAGTLTDSGTVFNAAYYEDSSYTGAYDLRSLTWADTDNDGDLDLLVPSVFDLTNFVFETLLLRNDGPNGSGGWIFTDQGAAIDATVHAQSAWADDDGDLDLDLFLVNIDPYTQTGFVRRFQNDGGSFSGQDLLGIKVEYGLADWGDYDADTDLDILVAGNIQEEDLTYNTVLRIYTNTGTGYVETTLIDAPNAEWLDLHAATWADYDSDGDMDLLITGNYVGASEIEGKSEVYGNDGTGTFTALGVALPAPISSVGRGGTFTWLDIDGDGDLDYFVAGAYYVPGGNGLVEAQMHLYRNDVLLGNSSPTAPGAPQATVAGTRVTLSWDAAFDDSTPSDALTYELAVAPAGAPAAAEAASGRRLPEPGNLSAVTGWVLDGLPGGTYDWSVRAVDSAFNGGPPAGGQFTVEGGAVLDLTVVGSCPGPVSVSIRNGTPNSEVAVVSSANRRGFTKGGRLCAGTRFELGEPLVLPPTWIRTDADGNGSGPMTLKGEACWVEALDIGTCQVTGARQAAAP